MDGPFNTRNTSSTPSTIHHSHPSHFPLSPPISLIISPGASASHTEIKVAVTHTASEGWFRSISLQYIIPLWMMKECRLRMEMTLLRGKYSKGRCIRTPSQGIGLQDGKSNTRFELGLLCQPVHFRGDRYIMAI